MGSGAFGIDEKKVREITRNALLEDIGKGDITSAALISEKAQISARFVAGEEGVLAGLPVAEKVFAEIDPAISFQAKSSEGARIEDGQELAVISGSARSILSGERCALNFLQRLSGIATLTAKFVNAVSGTGAKIYDTRKTTPNLRILEKYAVRAGGGYNHRMGLFDQVLIKDNHIAAALKEGIERLSDIVQKARRSVPEDVKIEVEVDDLEGFEDSLAGRPDIIMLDNMTAEEMKKAVGLIKDKTGRPLIEASGNIDLEGVRQVADSGVDIISIGGLTHSARALDISLEFD